MGVAALGHEQRGGGEGLQQARAELLEHVDRGQLQEGRVALLEVEEGPQRPIDLRVPGGELAKGQQQVLVDWVGEVGEARDDVRVPIQLLAVGCEPGPDFLLAGRLKVHDLSRLEVYELGWGHRWRGG